MQILQLLSLAVVLELAKYVLAVLGLVLVLVIVARKLH
jgi:uncharacterized membrane protein